MLLQRILTALVLAPLAILIILLPPTGIFATIVALAFLAAWWEWAELSGLSSRPWRIALRGNPVECDVGHFKLKACCILPLPALRGEVDAP